MIRSSAVPDDDVEPAQDEAIVEGECNVDHANEVAGSSSME